MPHGLGRRLDRDDVEREVRHVRRARRNRKEVLRLQADYRDIDIGAPRKAAVRRERRAETHNSPGAMLPEKLGNSPCVASSLSPAPMR